MAWIWGMTINCASEADAKEVERRFDASGFSVPTAGSVSLNIGIEHTNSGWEVGVVPRIIKDGRSELLNGHGSASDENEIIDIDATAKVLYDRLAQIQTYRFALTGFEVSDWRSAGELLDDISPGSSCEDQLYTLPNICSGLVIASRMWALANYPHTFVEFSSEEHMWLPYTTIKDAQ